MIPVPVASDPAEEVADWIELQAVRSPGKQASMESVVRVIRRGGSTDAIENARGDAGSELSQRVAEEAFIEIENRIRACGHHEAYPFEVEPGLIRLKKGWKSSPYVTLLLLSATAPTAGHNGTAVLFERICRYAALEYCGGAANGTDAIRFGSPRRAPHAKFHQAVDNLCGKLSEGGGCRQPHLANHTGDDGLDIVAWRPFPDLKEGKLVAFGQCAAGAVGWEAKLSELDGEKFTQKWFRQMLVTKPIRLFFLPRRISRERWENAGIDGGILFDRCRIASCLRDLDADLVKDCKAAVAKLIAKP
jgi:hypothetical protein